MHSCDSKPVPILNAKIWPRGIGDRDRSGAAPVERAPILPRPEHSPAHQGHIGETARFHRALHTGATGHPGVNSFGANRFEDLMTHRVGNVWVSINS